MSRRLAVLAAGLSLCACAHPALAAFPHGVGGGGGGTAPLVSPGPTQPTISTVAGFSISGGGVVLTGGSVNNITPAWHGNNADTGYNVRGIIRADQIPWREIGRSSIDTTFHIGFSVYHQPTDAEKALGLASNIDHVDVRCDENTSWTTITSQTVNPDASNRTDWNVYSHTSLWADGLHKCDMRAVPTTGPDIIAQGRGIDQYGNLYEDIKVQNAVVSDGHGGAGNILTIPTGLVYNYTNAQLSGNALSIGQSVAMLNVGPDTFIDGDSTHSATSCAAQWGSNCNGAGGANQNYHVTQASIGGIAFNGTASGYGITLNTYSGVVLPQVGSYIVRADLPANLKVVQPTFTASVSGTKMTVTVAPTTGALQVGMRLGYFLTPSNAFGNDNTIVGDSTHSANLCTPNCTGTGGTGTYAIASAVTIGSDSGYFALLPAQTGEVIPVDQSVSTSAEAMVASVPAEFGIAKSFYFFTNYGGTLYRPKLYLSPSGTDNAGCGAIGSPCQTLLQAERNAWTNDPTPITSHNAVYGAVLCFEDPTGTTTYSYNGAGVGNQPDSSVGWTEFVNASDPVCNVGGDHGNATLMGTDNGDLGSFAMRTMWRNIHSGGPLTLWTGNLGFSQQLAADHLTRTPTSISGVGLLASGAVQQGTAGLIDGAAYCVDSVVWWGQGGLCDPALMVRGNSAKYFTVDSLHNDEFAINNSFDHGGVIFYWSQASTTLNSNVITGVSILPAELSGVTLAALYNPHSTPVAGQPAVMVVQAGSLTECFPDNTTTGILFAGATTANTITVVDASGNPVNATATCTNGNLSWPLIPAYAPHPDNLQLSIDNVAAMDLVIDSNNFATTTSGFQQGQFFERTFMSGGWVGNNAWKQAGVTTARLFLSNGGNQNITQFNNTYTGGTAGFAVDNNGASSGMTYIKDVCPGVGALLPPVNAGTGQRSLAAVLNACYTTSTP